MPVLETNTEPPGLASLDSQSCRCTPTSEVRLRAMAAAVGEAAAPSGMDSAGTRTLTSSACKGRRFTQAMRSGLTLSEKTPLRSGTARSRSSRIHPATARSSFGCTRRTRTGTSGRTGRCYIRVSPERAFRLSRPREYNKDHHDAVTRRIIAFWVLTIVSVLYLLAVVGMICHWINVEELGRIALVLGPIQALAAAVLGFYFGRQHSS